MMNPSSEARRANPDRQIYGLDVIRFLAALLVVGHHLGFMIWVRHVAEMNYRYLGPYTWAGWIGVEIFFVLSGFVIAYSAARSAPLAFAEGRLIRLYPAAWICSTITVATLLLTHQDRLNASLLERWRNAVLLFPGDPLVDGAYWTLAIELSFYLLVFILLAAKRFRYLGIVMSLIGTISSASWMYYFLWRHSLVQTGSRGQAYLDFLRYNVWAPRILLQHGCFFAIGALLWLCFLERAKIPRLVMLLVCCVGGLCEISCHGDYILWFAHAEYSRLVPVIIWLTSIAAIGGCIRYNRWIGCLIGDKGASITRSLGVITYPLYLLNQVVGWALVGWIHRLIPDVMALVLSIVILVTASYLIHWYLEKPVQRVLRNIFRLSSDRRVRPVAATAP